MRLVFFLFEMGMELDLVHSWFWCFVRCMRGCRDLERRMMIERVSHWLFFCAALIAIGVTFGILIFIFVRGLAPFVPWNRFGSYEVMDFVVGDVWRPRFGEFGIGYMILSSLVATFKATLISVPISVMLAIFVVEFVPRSVAVLLEFVIEVFAGIPSIFYGIFGFVLVMPLIEWISPYASGDSMLAVVIVLVIMIVPTVTLVSIGSLRAVPMRYREASLALGASKVQNVFKVMLPAAHSGIMAGILIGAGRVIGETMAVTLVSGNSEGGVPRTIFDSVRLLTANIALEQSYAADLHEQMLWATAMVLVIFVVIINFVLRWIERSVD